MSRKPLFLVYGIATGVLWATVVNRVAANTLVPATIWIVILAVIFGFLAWHWAASTELSSKQLLLLPVFPFVFLVGLFSLGVFLVMLGVTSPFLVVKEHRRQRQFEKLMKSQGRFIAINDHVLQAGESRGTLIVEYGLKGPRHIWWTEDDLSALGEPVSREEELRAIIDQKEHSFNYRCRTEYLDAKIGKASLTSIPSCWAKSTKLADMFPKMKIVTVVQVLLREKHDGQ